MSDSTRRRITFSLSETQWVHVIACTGMGMAMGETWWGVLAFPCWYAIAFAGQFIDGPGMLRAEAAANGKAPRTLPGDSTADRATEGPQVA